MIAEFSDYASNERTFLAWVRTAIAIMGFGLAAAQFSNRNVDTKTEILKLAAGGLVILCAYIRMRHLRALIAKNEKLGQGDILSETLLMVLIALLVLLLSTFALHVP